MFVGLFLFLFLAVLGDSLQSSKCLLANASVIAYSPVSLVWKGI